MQEPDAMRDAMHRQTRIMLELQDDMNARVDRDWRTREREWYRAIWIECAELMDHYGGWKWWKHTARDVEQVMLEIVDIWHFGLSMRIANAAGYDVPAARIVAEWRAGVPSQGFLRDVETLAAAALVTREFQVAMVPVLLRQIDRGFDDLYRAYVGKNVLNFFRQDHGYKDGTYRKTWQGREDNEHLSEILTGLDSESANFKDDIYIELTTRYFAG